MATPHQANSRVFRHQFRRYRDTIVARRIVGNDDFEIAQALALGRSDGIGQMRRAIIVGHDNADRRLRGRMPVRI
jgi:hypothetical protein